MKENPSFPRSEGSSSEEDTENDESNMRTTSEGISVRNSVYCERMVSEEECLDNESVEFTNAPQEEERPSISSAVRMSEINMGPIGPILASFVREHTYRIIKGSFGEGKGRIL